MLYEMWTNQGDESIRGANASLLDTLKGKMELGTESKVMEFGCGTAGFAALVHQTTGASVTAIDESWITVQKARACHIDVEIQQGSSARLSAENETFDCAYVADVATVSHELDKVLSQMTRVLKPEGFLVLSTRSHAQMAGSMEARYFPSAAQSAMETVPDVEDILALAGQFGLQAESVLDTGKRRCVMNREFLSTVRAKAYDLLPVIPGMEFAEGMAKLEDDYYGAVKSVTHMGETIIVLKKEAVACKSLKHIA